MCSPPRPTTRWSRSTTHPSCTKNSMLPGVEITAKEHWGEYSPNAKRSCASVIQLQHMCRGPGRNNHTNAFASIKVSHPWMVVRPARLWFAFPGTVFGAGAYATRDCKFGEGVKVHSNSVLSKTSVGRYTYIATGSRLHLCSIGAICSVGPEVMVGMGRHPSSRFASTHPAFFSTNAQSGPSLTATSKFDEFSHTCIGNDVWIGARAILLDGVSIGDGAVVGAGSVVTREVGPYSVVGGVPNRLIRRRFPDDQVAFLLRLQWWQRDLHWPREHAHLFHDIDLLRSSVEKPAVQR